MTTLAAVRKNRSDLPLEKLSPIPGLAKAGAEDHKQ
jgi:hypothetical protein